MKPQTQSTKTKSYVLQLFFVLPALQKKATNQKRTTKKSRHQKKKKWENTIAPQRGGDEDAERPPLALDPLLEVCWLPPMGQGVQGLDFCRFWGLEGILLETFLLDLFWGCLMPSMGVDEIAVCFSVCIGFDGMYFWTCLFSSYNP